MGRKYAIRDQEGLYFVTFTVVNWIDLFIRDEYKEIIMDSLLYCQKNKGLLIYSYCIMTSHIHLIIRVDKGHILSDVIRDFKSYTSLQLKKSIKNNKRESRKEWVIWMMQKVGEKNKRNRGFQLWQQHNHPIELTTNEMMDQRLAYIHNNPVEAGFVDDPCAWIWSSCSDYEKGMKGKLNLVFIE